MAYFYYIVIDYLLHNQFIRFGNISTFLLLKNVKKITKSERLTNFDITTLYTEVMMKTSRRILNERTTKKSSSSLLCDRVGQSMSIAFESAVDTFWSTIQN